MIGTPKTLKVHVSRKLGDNEFGSYGVDAELEVSLPPDANRDEAFDENDAWLTAAVGRSMAEKKASIQKMQAEAAEAKKGQTVEAEEAETKQDKPKADAKEGEELTFKCVKFTLAKLPDKKFKLELYPEIKDAPGKYPTIKFTAEREKMWDMLHDVADDYDFSDLPVEYGCEFLVHYAIGREFEIKAGEHKGEKSHYKDLLSIVAM
ncbi:MAG: hypothetical protein WC935_00125 [Thermoleophilia bacterium]